MTSGRRVPPHQAHWREANDPVAANPGPAPRASGAQVRRDSTTDVRRQAIHHPNAASVSEQIYAAGARTDLPDAAPPAATSDPPPGP